LVPILITLPCGSYSSARTYYYIILCFLGFHCSPCLPYPKTVSYATLISYCCMNATAAVQRYERRCEYLYRRPRDWIVNRSGRSFSPEVRFSKAMRLLFKLSSPENVQKSSPPPVDGLNVRYTLVVRTYLRIYHARHQRTSC